MDSKIPSPSQPEIHPTEPILEHLVHSNHEDAVQHMAIAEHGLQAHAETTQSIRDLEPVLEHILTTIAQKPEVQKVKLEGVEVLTLKGDKGDKGDEPGDERLVKIIKPLIPAPLAGEKGDTGEKPGEEDLVALIKPLIPAPIPGKKGNDGKNGTSPDKDEIVSEVLSLIPKPKDGKPGKAGSPDTGKDIIKKIDGLLEYVHIKDAPKIEDVIRIAKQSSRGFAVSELDDVVGTPIDGQSLTYDAVLKKWKPATSGSTSPLTTKGDLYGFSTVNARLPVGTDGQVLTADSTQPLGVKYAAITVTGTVTNVSSATTDLAVATPTTTPVITVVSAPKLTTARTINGVAFDGTINVTVADATKVPYTGATANVDLGLHNLTVDTNSLVVDSVNHRVGIGTIAPAYPLDVVGQLQASSNIRVGTGTATPLLITGASMYPSVSNSYFAIYNDGGAESWFQIFGNTNATPNILSFGTTNVERIKVAASGSVTLSSLASGLVKSASGVLSNATAGTDYQAPITLTTTGTSGAATFISNTLNVPNYSAGSGGITRSINSISTATTAGATATTDYVYFVSGATTLTLPTAVGNTNRYTIKNSGVNTVTIATTSAQTIDGSASATLPVQYTSLDLVSDGANWNVV